MPQIQYDTWKKYWPLIIIGAILLSFIPGLIKIALKENLLAPEVTGELIIKENGAEISRQPFLSCGGSPFGVALLTKDKEGIFFGPNFPAEIDYYQPPTGGRYYGRPCQFTKKILDPCYSPSADFLINLFSRIHRDRGSDYWSGTIQASCAIESTNKRMEINADFKNCHTDETQP